MNAVSLSLLSVDPSADRDELAWEIRQAAPAHRLTFYFFCLAYATLGDELERRANISPQCRTVSQ